VVRHCKLFLRTISRRISFLVLLSAVLNRIFSFAKSDVHFDIPFESLLSIGCSECEDSGLTASGNLTSCSGPFFSFGVKSIGSDVFDIGAYALEAKKHCSMRISYSRVRIGHWGGCQKVTNGNSNRPCREHSVPSLGNLNASSRSFKSKSSVECNNIYLIAVYCNS
jgi:hypothetical protein